MNLKDVIDLAKAGYKPADIRELVEIAKESKEVKDEPEEPEKEPDPEPAIDYKKLYEESQAKLSQAQKSNAKKTISKPEEKTDEDVFKEFCVSFM